MPQGAMGAGCGEWNEIAVDEPAGSRQQSVEDGQVCSKPDELAIGWNAAEEEYEIRAELESWRCK